MLEWFKTFASDDIGKTITGAFIALAAVALGALLGVLKDLFVESAKRKRLAWLTAVRLTVILDRYVDECATHADDDGEADEKGYYRLRHPQPDLVYPEDLAWTSLTKQLMYDAFKLKVRHDGTISGLDFLYNEVASPPDYGEYFAEKGEKISRRGQDAVKLVGKLKRKYGVPTADRNEYSPQNTFDRVVEAYETRVAKREVRRQELERKRVQAGEPPDFI
ncbi:hypothetical protein [Rhizobium rhizogenes]|uniref:hypothetical protein n=1 Tax=Rhizobium rhizogenes TaxID=359 RepID=UPI001571787C|nr:hypothetical protein [Rhizobium rhizogenes]NTF64963.1 hypothetical protein [Rhizobium rhizogenes]NTG96311.1 hypothetical protein [Rhizobium rhizogenes]